VWHLIPLRWQVLIITACAVVLAWAFDGATEWLQGQRAPLLKFISMFATIITTVVAGIASLTWRYFWRAFPVISRKTFPDLNGQWGGTLVSTWIDPTTSKPPAPIGATIWIRQTLFSVTITLRTGESTSYSTRYFLEAERDAGRFRVWYSYGNLPKAQFAYRSSRHEGVAWLEIDADADPDRLEGQYYTDRRTTGDMAFRRISAR
jgi:SMODS-associating 2TM, beta-strand rich effector domain